MAHPVLYISPDTAGLVYINGHLAGECGAATPLVMPVAPQGAVYLEYHPLRAGVLPVSRRLNLAGGYIAPGSEPIEEMYIVAWPDSVIDVEISPRRTGPLAGAQRLSAGGCELYVLAGDGAPGVARLVRGGELMEARLPAGARDARALETSDGRVMLLGRCDAGEFAQIYDAQTGALALDVAGREISPAERGGVQVLRATGDAAGHVLREVWRPSGRGYACRLLAVSRERPDPPDSPERAALMLAQALLMGRDEEALELLSEPARAQLGALRALVGRYDACCALKYGRPPGRIGLMKLVTPGYARVHALAYRASPAGAGWLVDEVRLD